MCGINGIIADWPQAKLQAEIAVMNRELIHRGPDAEGEWIGHGIALGHRRLSIVDLSHNAEQPMHLSERFAIVFNGEIYNYKELRSKLISQGHRFKTTSDTEVLLRLYEVYSQGCLSFVEGMFAFAIWDKEKKELFLARDRIGEKPIYYYQDANVFVFSSEIKALRRALPLRIKSAELNPSALAAMLVYSVSPAPITFFNEIKQVLPAHYMRYQAGKLKSEPYWRLNFNRAKKYPLKDALQEYEDLLSRVVAQSIQADVPVGLMLSGGVDSTSIVQMAAQNNTKLDTYSLSNGQAYDPDKTRARIISKKYATKHHEFDMQNLMLADLPNLVQCYDQPINSVAAVYIHKFLQELGKHIKVLVSGNGADEIFGGYTGYNPLRLYQPYIFSMVAVLDFFTRPLQDGWSKLGNFINCRKLPPGNLRPFQMKLKYQHQLRQLFTDKFIQSVSSYAPEQHLLEAGITYHSGSFLDEALGTDLMVFHQHGHCVIPDSSGMLGSIEVRSPFLNHKVIEFAAQLPLSHLIHVGRNGLVNKYLMKKYLEKHFSRKFINHKKTGFGYLFDLKKLLYVDWGKAIEHQILNGEYMSMGYINREYLRLNYKSSLELTWSMLMFSIWCDLYIFGKSSENISESLLRHNQATAACLV